MDVAGLSGDNPHKRHAHVSVLRKRRTTTTPVWSVTDARPIISLEEYLGMAADPTVPDEDILAYSLVEQGRGPFDPQVRPGPRYVSTSRRTSNA